MQQQRMARDPLTKGLASIALVRLVGADLGDEKGRLLDQSRAWLPRDRVRFVLPAE